MADPAVKYQTVEDLRRRARRRTPRFAWEYLDSGEGSERARDRNAESLQRVLLTPRFLKGELEPDVSTELFGARYSLPVGIAPMGLTGLMWPAADTALADTAARCSIPLVASTVNTADVSVLGPRTQGMGWFQLYPPRDTDIREDLLNRAHRAGFSVLVVTADVPARARRERQSRQRVSMPPRITPRHVAQAALRPAWTLGLLRNGIPRFHTLEHYVDRATLRELAGFVGASLGGTLSWDYLAETCELWPGPVVVKGILHPDDAARCVVAGADAVVVSNHGGRQLDAAPAAIEALGPVVERIGGRVPVLFDGGIRSGLDIARALALGADFTFTGRSFMFGLCALGAGGADFVVSMFEQQLTSVMHQLGCERLAELRDRDPRLTPC
ncbi:MAG: alpha-hydroxy-acid oxidizing protein [Acidimicrobiaceae bacterium]|nr:alpha-hydroxy-acid oxidizing protein [Acidimicrobiaceae bacterium]